MRHVERGAVGQQLAARLGQARLRGQAGQLVLRARSALYQAAPEGELVRHGHASGAVSSKLLFTTYFTSSIGASVVYLSNYLLVFMSVPIWKT